MTAFAFLLGFILFANRAAQTVYQFIASNLNFLLKGWYWVRDLVSSYGTISIGFLS